MSKWDDAKTTEEALRRNLFSAREEIRLRSNACTVNLTNDTHARLVVEAYRQTAPGEDVRDRMTKIAEEVLTKYLAECEAERNR